MSLRITGFVFFPLTLIIALTHNIAVADTLELADGSRLVGEITGMDSKHLTMKTAFSDNLEISTAQVKGITTDNKVTVTLSSGDRVNGRLQYKSGSEQQIKDTLFGDITLENDIRIAGINDSRGRSEELKLADEAHEKGVEEIKQSHQQEKKALQSDYEKEIATLKQEKNRLLDPWSGNIAFGITGQEGNTQEFSVQGRGELYRETEFIVSICMPRETCSSRTVIQPPTRSLPGQNWNGISPVAGSFLAVSILKRTNSKT